MSKLKAIDPKIAVIDFTALRPAPTRRAEAVARARTRIDQIHAAALSTGASPQEQATWPLKTAAARAVLARTAGPADKALLQPEAKARGESLTALARTILVRGEAQREAQAARIAAASALRASARVAIARACDADLADPADLETALTKIVAQTAKAAARLG